MGDKGRGRESDKKSHKRILNRNISIVSIKDDVGDDMKYLRKHERAMGSAEWLLGRKGLR